MRLDNIFHKSLAVILLKVRGLIISDNTKAIHDLESIGYYHLSTYIHSFLQNRKYGVQKPFKCF